VWRATDLVLARPVAVKLLRPEVAGDAETLARFRAEARHAGSLEHVGIARVFDYDEPGPGHPPFLVMEYVDGPSLAEVLDAGPLPPGRVLDIVAQAGAALAAAHQAGLVHRDIKPQNILLTRDGLVKLTDFGISFAAGAASLTSTGIVLGSSGYLAPERLEGSRGTAAGDVYALGVVAHQCLTGQPPFTGTPAEVARAHHSRPLPPLPPPVPAEVAGLIGALTAKDPARRPAADDAGRRAAELRDQLEPPELPELTESELADPAPLTRPLDAAPARRRRLTLGLAAVAVLALTGWGVVSLLAPHGQHPSAAGPSRARTVEIDGARLRGQPVPAVTRELRHLGLIVHVRWRPTDREPPGRVLAVQPSGQVPARSVVVVTGARPPAGPAPSTPASPLRHHPAPRHGKGHGKGHKHGKGHGPGKPPKTSPPATPSPQPTSTSPSPTPATSPPATSPPASPAA
jgi:serine/threonine-protein kinase